MNRPRAHAVWARSSLRSRVLVLAVALLAVGFTTFSLLAGNALRGYLEGRTDNQLRAAAQVLSLLPSTMVVSGSASRPPGGVATQVGTEILGNPVITYVGADGNVEADTDSLTGTSRSADAPGPDLPRMDTAAVLAHGGRPFTVGSTQGDGRWRIIAVPRDTRASLPGAAASGSTSSSGSSGSVVVAMSLDQVDGTVGNMWRIFEITGLALLAFLAVAGWFAVRSGLRPLSRIEETAAEIADGDLSRRVPELAGPHTELGRLAAALNGMLSQLEHAFAARAASEARMSRFVADASHELRTPLAGIKGLTDLHRMGAIADRAEIDATMDRIARESDRLARLVEDMLLLARLDEASSHAADGSDAVAAAEAPSGLDLAPADLRTLAADALHDVLALDPTREVSLTGPAAQGPPAFAPALADEARLRQVVTNLVGNAVTHTPAGTPIRIGVGTLGDRAVLEVSDQGPGVTPEQAGRIFERFYRADTSRTRATGGAGLGLAIVQSLVSAHGGQVEVDSAPGRGATFRILLPQLVDSSVSAGPGRQASAR